LIGWLLDLLGISAHHAGSASANLPTTATDSTQPDSAQAGHPPARRPSPSALGTAVTGLGSAVSEVGSAATGLTGVIAGQDPRARHHPTTAATSLATLIPPVKPLLTLPEKLAAPAPRLVPTNPPTTATADPDLTATGRSKPELAQQWAAARQAARQNSGAAGSTATPAGQTSTDSAAGTSAAGLPAAAAAGAGAGQLLSVAVNMASSAVSALAGHTVGQHTHDMLSGIVRQVDSAFATGTRQTPTDHTNTSQPATVGDHGNNPGGAGAAGEWSHSNDTHTDKNHR
jgi:hypothetical protein